MDPIQALSLFKPIQKTGAVEYGGSSRAVQGGGVNPFAPQQRAEAYAQYDRGLEHGYGGAQYRNGEVIGKKLNFEC